MDLVFSNANSSLIATSYYLRFCSENLYIFVNAFKLHAFTNTLGRGLEFFFSIALSGKKIAFLLLHITKFPHMNEQYLNVVLGSVTYPTS